MTMKKILPLLFAIGFAFLACNNANNQSGTGAKPDSSFHNFLASYYEQHLHFYPFEATAAGDNRFNDQFPNDISFAYRTQMKNFLQTELDSLNQFDSSKWNENDKVSYEVLKWELQISLEGLQFPENLLPINQFWSKTLDFAQLGAGTGNEPFKTVKDYNDFLKRIDGFTVWCDTAIANMRIGMSEKIVLPKILAQRVIPQLQAMVVSDPKQSVYYGAITLLPASFSDSDKKRLTQEYTKAIQEKIIPTYKKLLDFFQKEYLPACRNSEGYADLPNGKAWYDWRVKYWTTTDLTPDSIFNLGMSEVKRIRAEMENIKDSVGYKGDLKSFFKYINTDPKFFPFKTDSDVIHYFKNIYVRETPQLNVLFDHKPTTPFEIRETEKFRAASASAEYNPASADGSRPGIFYVPILDATKYNYVGMESLFLHESIPGHHYQISFQQENKNLPDFRRFIWYGAYGEGWALYCESLGKKMGLYTDPYQQLGALSEEMHRAIRLVVDVGIHEKGWTREQAIQFSLDNEAESEQGITAEIERYMAIPGQALSYKIGQLNFIAQRTKAQQMLGSNFSYAAYHDQILSYGCLPLTVFNQQIDKWMAAEKK
jgi:uncharacterized protein (DUF885 family)